MEINLQGKRILVTGASRGIGHQIVLDLVKCKATIIAVSKTKQYLDSLKTISPLIETICVDLTDWDATREALKDVGPIHGLVNNAGMAIMESFLDFTKESLDRTFDINLKAVMNVSQIIAREMVARKEGGCIVNISSQASMIGLENHAVYCASKGALDALTRVMALELGPHNIRVNAVNPTVINTDMTKSCWIDPIKKQQHMDMIPLKRFGEPREVSEVVVFLLSNMASMINGVALPIDGGYTAV